MTPRTIGRSRHCVERAHQKPSTGNPIAPRKFPSLRSLVTKPRPSLWAPATTRPSTVQRTLPSSLAWDRRARTLASEPAAPIRPPLCAKNVLRADDEPPPRKNSFTTVIGSLTLLNGRNQCIRVQSDGARPRGAWECA
jgi:hypothetical protein